MVENIVRVPQLENWNDGKHKNLKKIETTVVNVDRIPYQENWLEWKKIQIRWPSLIT